MLIVESVPSSKCKTIFKPKRLNYRVLSSLLWKLFGSMGLAPENFRNSFLKNGILEFCYEASYEALVALVCLDSLFK